jgi:hypothetical protein
MDLRMNYLQKAVLVRFEHHQYTPLLNFHQVAEMMLVV